MADVAIRVSGLSKLYQIGAAADKAVSFPEAVQRFLTAPFRRDRPSATEDHWALKDVNFEIRRGEAVGIVGRNGAGKSTLLKILSRITEPTSGEIELRGRVASLLEVGTGFHPELTGRENIFLNGAVLGMRNREIQRKFDDIVAFAEIEKFLDTPVKRYSSGMYVRLAFAVAAHLEPEILVVDEVLAVGDAAFQKKCLGKMEHVAHQGRTVLFVSHNMSVVRQLCTRGVLLKQGSVARIGSIDDVIHDYLEEAELSDEVVLPLPRDPGTAYFTRFRLLNQQGDPCSRFAHSQDIVTEIEYTVRETLSADHLWWQLSRSDGLEVLGSGDLDCPEFAERVRPPGRYRATVRFPGGILNEGKYQYRVALADSAGHVCDYQYGTYFEIYDDTDYGVTNSSGKRNGVVLQRLRWDETRIGEFGP